MKYFKSLVFICYFQSSTIKLIAKKDVYDHFHVDHVITTFSSAWLGWVMDQHNAGQKSRDREIFVGAAHATGVKQQVPQVPIGLKPKFCHYPCFFCFFVFRVISFHTKKNLCGRVYPFRTLQDYSTHVKHLTEKHYY